MSDENTNPEAEGQANALPVKMNILAQYIRDMSFENAVAQNGMPEGEVQPEISVQVSLDARKRGGDHQYEVVTKFRVGSTNKATDSNLFLCELDYGALFHVENVPEDQLHPFLMIECPRMIFPFVRRIISDVTRDGGFPPVNLDPVDFVAIYRQEIARRAQSERPEGQPLS